MDKQPDDATLQQLTASPCRLAPMAGWPVSACWSGGGLLCCLLLASGCWLFASTHISRQSEAKELAYIERDTKALCEPIQAP